MRIVALVCLSDPARRRRPLGPISDDAIAHAVVQDALGREHESSIDHQDPRDRPDGTTASDVRSDLEAHGCAREETWHDGPVAR